MPSKNNTFGTALCCMDGRAIAAATEYLKRSYGVFHVDCITEPGMDSVLVSAGKEDLANFHRKAAISVERHDSRVIAIVGHYDCAAYPAPKEEHLSSIRQGIATISAWTFEVPDDISIIGLWAEEKNDVWQAKIVDPLSE